MAHCDRQAGDTYSFVYVRFVCVSRTQTNCAHQGCLESGDCPISLGYRVLYVRSFGSSSRDSVGPNSTTRLNITQLSSVSDCPLHDPVVHVLVCVYVCVSDEAF